MDSHIISLNEELQDIRNKYNELREGNASKNHLIDDTPMCKCHEANYIQSEGYQNQNSHDSYSHQTHYDSNDSEKSLTELNNDVINDLEDFKRCIHSMRTVHWKLFARDDGKTTGVLPKKKYKPINQEPQSKTDFEKLMTKFLDDQRVTNMFFKNNVNDMIIKMKQNEKNCQTKIKNMERKMDEWEKSQNISSEQTGRTDPLPPPAQTEQVNAIFIRSGKSNYSLKILKDPPSPISVNNKIKKDKPIKTLKKGYYVVKTKDYPLLSVIEEVGDMVEGDIVDPKRKDKEETDSVQMEEAKNKDVSSEEGDKNEDCSDQVENENDESRKNTAWVDSEYIVSKSGIGCTPRRGSKKVAYVKTHVVNDDFINLVKVADENNKVDGVIDGEAGDEIKNDEIGNKEYIVDNCDMNGRVMKANAVLSEKDNEKGSCGKKYRRHSFKLAKAGTRWKRSHSSSNALGCSRNYLNGDMNKKGRGLVKTNVMGPTCSVSEGRLKKAGEQIGVVYNDMDETKIPCVAVAKISTKGVEGKKGWVMSIIRGEEPDVITLQETKSRLVDNFWVEEVWGNRNFGFTQMEAKGDQVVIAVKNGRKGVSGNIVLVCLYGPHEMEDFNNFINITRLVEILLGGQKFTRISDDGLKFSKLDRFLVSKGFKNKWDNLSMVALDKKLSDHCPIVLKDMDNKEVKSRRPDFWFSKEAMGWELEAKSRALDDDERLKWLEARHLWIGKERE
ncbi:reverse transcriptase domain-containing protein [Tanacetum coccineum]